MLLGALGSGYYKGLSCLFYCITITRFHTLNCQTSKQVPEQPQLLLGFLNTTPHRFMTYLPGMEVKAPPHIILPFIFHCCVTITRSA